MEQQAQIESLEESLEKKDEHLSRLADLLNTLTARVNAMEKLNTSLKSSNQVFP